MKEAQLLISRDGGGSQSCSPLYSSLWVQTLIDKFFDLPVKPFCGVLREQFCTVPSKIRTFFDVNWTTTGASDHYKSHSVNYDGRCPLLLLLVISAHHRMVFPSLINKNAGVSDVMNGSVRSKRFQSSYCAKGRFFLLSSQLFSTNSRGNAWYAGYMNGNPKFGFSLDEALVSDIPRWKLLLNSSSMMLSSQKTD